MSNPTDASQAGLTGEELEQQLGEALPDREAMSTIITGTGVDNFAAPINEALAVNVNTTDSYAIADADQIVILNQESVDVDDGTSLEGDDADLHPHPHGKDH